MLQVVAPEESGQLEYNEVLKVRYFLLILYLLPGTKAYHFLDSVCRQERHTMPPLPNRSF